MTHSPSSAQSDEQAALEKIARALHYPACWDTATYPTLASAISEAVACHKIGCSECEARAASPAPASPSGEDAAEQAAAPMATTVELETAVETLRHVIECLRQTGSFTDEEGEATDFLEPLLTALPHASEQADDPLRAAVESMVCMLENGEWAEHASTYKAPGDKLAARLEAAITDLHNELSGDSEQADEAVTLTANYADMFWPEHDGEQMYHSLDDAVTAAFEDSGADAGDTFTFTCAARLPKVTARIIEVTENGFEWEEIDPAKEPK